MTQRVKRIQGCAPGYWAPDPHARLQAERTPDKVRRSLEDQLRTNGHPIWVWLPVTSGAAGTVACTCDKDTTSSADYKCITCYGHRFAPGYLKFLHETLFFCSAEQANFTLTNVAVDLRKKPNRLQLTAGAVSGTIVTPDKSFANAAGDAWEVELAAYKKQAGDDVTLEFSTDSGTTWTAVTLTGGPLFGYRGALEPAPSGTGVLRFRVTLTRTSGATPESPSFEIVRARHVRSRDWNTILRQRIEASPGQILILRTWDQEMVLRDMARGRITEALGDRSMTAPLDFFDISIGRDTPPAAFDDRDTGPHPLFEYASGVRTAQRYAMYAINLDTTLDNVMSHQSFSERRVQPGEVYSLVF